MATVAVLLNSYITDEITEDHLPNSFAGISRFAPVTVVISGHISANAPGGIDATVKLQHADAIEGPYEDVPGCTLQFSGSGAHAVKSVELDAKVLKDFLAAQTFADVAADGGATVFLVQ